MFCARDSIERIEAEANNRSRLVEILQNVIEEFLSDEENVLQDRYILKN